MRYRLTFIAGVALGYVLGTRAGRERYEQLKKAAQQLAEDAVLVEGPPEGDALLPLAAHGRMRPPVALLA
ncbi:DUF5682 family protein, partial [Streptomyces sp. NPDC007107]|uniref:DUF5682 family protein n=1 Tax=Streptomyces sp. NPDC007107 TaxID=3156915 RepID=UPI0033D5ACE0